MDQNKAYDTMLEIAVGAAKRIDSIFVEAIERQQNNGREVTELACKYATALMSVATMLNSTVLMRPISPYMGFCAGPAKEGKQ